MHDSDRNDGSAGVIVGATVLLLVILGGGALLWLRQQKMLVARAEQMRAEAMMAVEIAKKNEATARESIGTRPVATDSFEAIITKRLNAQQEAWNRGDVNAFMEPYWNSDRLTFASSGKVTRGWSATLDRYKTKYPTSKEMGHLTFDHLEFTPIGSQAALVLGEWKLNRIAGDIGGNFSLVWQFIDGQWVIIHDHSSASEFQ